MRSAVLCHSSEAAALAGELARFLELNCPLAVSRDEACSTPCDRLAEAYEVLEIMADAMRAQGDQFSLHKLEWQKSWFREAWDLPATPPSPPFSLTAPAQLSLPFAAGR